MKEIVVLSGKGGVGKSSITASICHILSKEYRLIICDTDVDAPNLALFFDAFLKESIDVSASEKAFINHDICTNCMRCVDVCRFSSMSVYESKPFVISYSCEGCGACVIACPENAIEIKNVKNGNINFFDIDNIMIVSGELNIGESSSGHLIDVLKTIAKEKAEITSADVILTDGPPGIGCPVISSIKGCDYVVAVTEPTPAALSDLNRLIEVIGYFRTPFSIVINKSDMHLKSREKIEAFAKERKIPILSEIPYDLSIPKALAKGMPVIKAFPDAPSSIAIKHLADKVTDIIQQLN